MRAWTWQLPSGERVTARTDAKAKLEMVYVGRRLVARVPMGQRPDGHVVPTRGAGEGAYRGGAVTRVVFGDEGRSCELRIDSEVIEPEPEPEPVASSVERSALVPILGVAVFVLLASSYAVWRTKRTGASSDTGTAAPATRPPLGALVHSADSPNRLFTVLYPDGFTVRSWAGSHPSVQLDREDDSRSRIVFRSDLEPGTSDIWELEKHLSEGEALGTYRVEGEERSEGECLGYRAAIVVRHLVGDKARSRAWSCAFLTNGHGFRFITYAPTLADEADLRSIVDAAKL